MLALLIASAMAGESHTVAIDLFAENGNPNSPDWDAARLFPAPKPYIPWTIDAQQGDGVVQFGEVRFRDDVITGNEAIDIVMAVRVNSIDDYFWLNLSEGPDLLLASQPKDPSWISDDPLTRIWEDQPGFYIFDHDITNLTVTGLSYTSSTRIDVAFLAVTGVHDSMGSHRLTHCLGTDLVQPKGEGIYSTTPIFCGGTDLKLVLVGWMAYKPFLDAPKVAPVSPKQEDPLSDEVLRSIFAPK